MPIRKFRSVEEMEALPPRRPLDPDNLRIAWQLMRLLYGLRPWLFERGVHKFRSLSDKHRHQEEWERRNRRVPA